MIKKLILLALIFAQGLLLLSFEVHWSTVREIITKDWQISELPKHLVEPNKNWNAEEILLHYVGKIIDYALYFAGLVAVIVLIVWGFRYVTYFWVEDAENQAKMLIVNALLWLIIIICSALIVDNADRILKFIIWE